MPLEKQALNINFAQGLDTKTDPKQVQPGKFLSLQNAVFNKGGLLQKRNGFTELTTLANANYLSTFKSNLLGIGTGTSGTFLSSFSQSNNVWTEKGTLVQTSLAVESVVSNNSQQTTCDMAVAPNALACAVFIQTGGAVSPSYDYVIYDTTTGQNIVNITAIVPTAGSVQGAPKVWVVGNYFFIVFPVLISATSHLQYISIPTNTLIANTAVDITSTFIYDSRGSFDGYSINNSLYLAYNASGPSLKVTAITSHLVQQRTITFSGPTNSIVNVSADATTSTPIIYVHSADPGNAIVHSCALDANLNTIFTVFTSLSGTTAANLASYSSNGVSTLIVEVVNNYGYDSAIASHYITRLFVYQAGTASGPTLQMRGVGLASKAFQLDTGLTSHCYCLVAYQSSYQSTYFLMQVSSQYDVSAINFGMIVSVLANQNGGGYLAQGLPNANITSSGAVFIPYLYKESIATINKGNGATVGNVAGVYAQLGINAVIYQFKTNLLTYEIGNNLHLTGGYIAAYDGYGITEQGFFLYPDSVEVTTSSASGAITAQQYFYQAVYEWSDNQGNIHQSAPSIPVSVTTTGGGSTNTIYVPTLRATSKRQNPVKICLYRYSTAQQTYYQVTSITTPVLNDVSVDYVTITDALADSSILGNAILYTTGGLVENIAPPATNVMALYKSRLFVVDAETPNLLWYSKQVLQATPVEFSDLFTIYVAPTTSSEESTGNILALYPLDDKLIIFKQDAIYYLVGNGPDNTGSNNDFGEPVFVTSNVGCSNPASIVLTPLGLMFQSDKGIWLLSRDLSTVYIGAPVESSNIYQVTSALNIPQTNQIRFTLSGTNQFLMYDTYYNQWGTFIGLSALNSVLYNGLQTFIDPYNRIFQESPGTYLDGSIPVVMQFTTSWLHLAGIQGYQRAYFLYLLATYLTPYTMTIQIGYDYEIGVSQVSTITPSNFAPPYGGDNLYGGGNEYGGPSVLAQNRIFLDTQKCQAIQISIQENFDASKGVPAGAGFTMSGLTMVVGAKSGWPRVAASQNVGGNS